jgi:rhodanese-related sulfurtransferase
MSYRRKDWNWYPLCGQGDCAISHDNENQIRSAAMNGTIDRDELQTKILRGDNFQLVEALPEDEFRGHHLPGAINLPPRQAKELAGQILPDKDADIVVYCANAMCTASEDVARDLISQGYRRVRRYVGGKQDWIDAGFSTVSGLQAVGRSTP